MGRLRRQFLIVRKHIDALSSPAVFDQLGAHKFTRRQEARHTFSVRSQTSVHVCFQRKNSARRAPAAITVFCHNIPETPALASLAYPSSRHQVVVRTQQFEIIQVIQNGNTTLLQLP